MNSITPEVVQQSFAITTFDIRTALTGVCDVALFDGRAGGYKAGAEAISKCRGLRGAIEERRKLLKADSLEYGRIVDRTAADLTALVTEFEKPLKEAKEAVDTAKAQAKAAALRAEEEARQAALREKMQAEEDALREQRQAEEKQLEQRRRELARLKEQAKAEADAEWAAMSAEREKMAAERAELEAARKELAAAKAKAESDQRAKEIAERIVAEAEEARIHQLEYERAKQERLAALAPDLEKIQAFGRALSEFALGNMPRTVRDPIAHEAIRTAVEAVVAIAHSLEAFQVPQ